MSGEPSRYDGPAVLRRDGAAMAVVAVLWVDEGHGVRSWAGRATTHDLAALALHGKSGVLELPDGREGEVWVPNAQIETGTPGVVVRLHGGGETAPWEKAT